MEKTAASMLLLQEAPESMWILAQKPSLIAVQISLSCHVCFVSLFHFSGFTPFLFYCFKPLASRHFLPSHHPFLLGGFPLPLRLAFCTDSFCAALPTPVSVNCAKSRHSRCRRYLSITLSPFCPSAKIKFAGSGTKQMLPLPWPLVALSQLRVHNNSRTLNLGLLVWPENGQHNALH